MFAEDWSRTPYWLADAPPAPPLDRRPPAAADVVVIGSGYTGLHAALETARDGRATVVLEAGDPGEGCSTRNGGQVSAGIKPSRAVLASRFGADRAAAIRAEGHAAVDWLEQFVAGEGIDCGFRRSGRFHAAHTPAAYDRLARAADLARREEGVEAHAVPRAEQHGELGSDFYHGGVTYTRTGHLHPARYHRGLLHRALAAGATVVPHCPAQGIRRDGEGWEVATPSGCIRARDVVVATNGYTGAVAPWLRRRVIPIGSAVIATEPLPPATMARLFPTGRIACDTRRVVYYYGPSPDGTRIVFGGRVSAAERDAAVTGPRLHAAMARIFPDLSGTRIAHSWAGFVAYSFDTLPHTGTHDGIHFALGYCGSGIALSSFLGMRAGRRVLGRADGRTAFDGLPFPTRPLYSGRPWFLPAAVAWYRMRDEIDIATARAGP